MTDDTPNFKLTRHVERKPTLTDNRPLDTMVVASHLIRAAGRREEVFPGMNGSMMVRFIAEDERFEGIRHDPERVAEKLLEMADDWRRQIAEQDMRWFDFGRLEGFERKSFREDDRLTLISSDPAIGQRVLFQIKKLHAGYWNNRQKCDVLRDRPIAVFGNDDLFLDMKVTSENLRLEDFAPVETFADISKYRDTVNDLATVIAENEVREEAITQENSKLRVDNRNITSSKYVNRASWKLSDKENIRLLTQVAKPEGHSFPVHFKGNDHFKRNLCLRYGINLTHRDQAWFNCDRIAWANNYWGTFKGYEDKGEVIISLWISGQNKGEAEVPDFDSDDAYDYFFDYEMTTKTTMVSKQHGDKFLELEIRYAPLSADFTGYDVPQLLEAHKLIMNELNK
jgi:hypothetical protein